MSGEAIAGIYRQLHSIERLYSCIFLEEEMVGVTGIEPVTPTMST